MQTSLGICQEQAKETRNQVCTQAQSPKGTSSTTQKAFDEEEKGSRTVKQQLNENQTAIDLLLFLGMGLVWTGVGYQYHKFLKKSFGVKGEHEGTHPDKRSKQLAQMKSSMSPTYAHQALWRIVKTGSLDEKREILDLAMNNWSRNKHISKYLRDRRFMEKLYSLLDRDFPDRRLMTTTIIGIVSAYSPIIPTKKIMTNMTKEIDAGRYHQPNWLAEEQTTESHIKLFMEAHKRGDKIQARDHIRNALNIAVNEKLDEVRQEVAEDIYNK